MHRLLHLLALIALLFAPLAAPAATMAAPPTVAECVEMAMDKTKHDMPAGDHGQARDCCIAVPPAIDPPLTSLNAVAAIDHLAFVTAIQPFHLGSGPNAEDPPPRSA